jgi:hypothetical protein
MNTYKFYKKHCFIYVCGFILATISVFYNDIYIRPMFYSYDSILRCFDHFVAGLFVPGLFSILGIENIKEEGQYYILVAFIYELSQVVEHGYFQYDQFFSDILGVAVLILIHRKGLFDGNNIKRNYSHNLLCYKNGNRNLLKKQRYLI